MPNRALAPYQHGTGTTGVLHEDAAGLIRLLTPAACEVFGLDVDERALIGRDAAAFHRMAATAFGDPAAYLRGISALRAGAREINRELVTTASDRHLERSCIPLGADGVLWTFRTVTNALTDEGVRDRVALYESIFAAMPAQMAILSTTGRYEFVTPSAIRNDTLRTWVIGRTDSEYAAYRELPPDIAQRREQAIREVSAGGRPIEYEETLIDATGTPRQFRRFMVPLLDEAGTVRRVLGYGLEVTEQRNVERQLQQAQKMEALGRLAGGIAHDFNNLLTVITGCSESLLFELDAQDDRRQLVEPVLEASQRAAELTRQLLAFSRHRGSTDQRVEVNALVERTVGMLRRLIHDNVQMQVTLADQPVSVRLEPSQLQQVLVNLAVNARDAMPDGGSLQIAVRPVQIHAGDGALPGGSYVELRVVDSGTGIPDEALHHIFEPFFTTKPVGAGTGLGLATVYGIVSRAEGTVQVTSAVGKGTTFRVLLPEVAATETPAFGSTAIAPQRGAGVVLVAEDATLIRELVRRELQQLGYTVLTAVDGQDALDVAAAYDGPIDLLLTDVIMPRLTGPSLVQTLRLQRPDTAVLFMSGYADDPAFAALLATGSYGFLQKPFSIHALAEHVAEALRQRAG